MTPPIININGDTKADLLEPVIAAIIALSDASKAVQAIAPNGRNYPAGNVQDARNRLAELSDNVGAVTLELIKYMEAIEAQ